jgi:hypothetical protein
MLARAPGVPASRRKTPDVAETLDWARALLGFWSGGSCLMNDRSWKLGARLLRPISNSASGQNDSNGVYNTVPHSDKGSNRRGSSTGNSDRGSNRSSRLNHPPQPE